MINAEELGVSSTSVAEAIKSEKPDIRRLVGTDGKLGEHIGLTDDWAVRIIALIGNYGESSTATWAQVRNLEFPADLIAFGPTAAFSTRPHFGRTLPKCSVP